MTEYYASNNNIAQILDQYVAEHNNLITIDIQEQNVTKNRCGIPLQGQLLIFILVILLLEIIAIILMFVV